MDKSLLEFAVEIIQSQASINKMSADEIETTLLKVYNALNRIQLAERDGLFVSFEEHAPGEAHSEPQASMVAEPGASIQEDKVICMECGAEFRQLTANHLKSHGTTPREYKKKWGFPLKQPLAARVLTRLRSRSAKKRGLPQRLQEYLEDQRQRKRIAESEGAGASDIGRKQAGGNSA